MELGWWERDAEGNKAKIKVDIHGRQIFWYRKPARFESWEELKEPSEEQWETLIEEAARRVPRRLITQKDFDMIKRRGIR